MTAERWQKVKEIFDDAVECKPALRAELLRERCGKDGELLREVESLLAADKEDSSLLNHPVVAAIAIAAAMPLNGGSAMTGRTIGNYLIGEELAHGGMGTVYRGRHITLPREVVVKCIRSAAFSEDARRDLQMRFRREAHIQCQLDHSHIVRVYEFFNEGDEYFLVMEYVPGFSLRSMLDRDRVLSAERAIHLTVQALDGLAHAHNLNFVDESGNAGSGVIHRDIKPANLLVDLRGNLKVTDFGIAKALSENSATKTGFSPGTVEYMSPEQIRGLAVDARSDLYSMGVTLYEALGGRVPFPRNGSQSDYDVLKAHIEMKPPPLRTLNPAVPAPLADIVARSMMKDPDRRWQTAAEFREALASSQSSQSFTTTPELPARPSRRYAVLALTAIAAAGAIWIGRGRFSRPSQEISSIAVLPFADMSPEKNREYFSDGLTEELSNALARTPGLRVAGRTSSFQFKGKTGDFPTIGKKLNVGAILEGSVRNQGNRARINVRLVKAADGFQLWSDSFDREMNDIFAVQAEIARAVTGALKLTLLGGNAAGGKAAGRPANTKNPDAYNAFLQGRYFLQRHNSEENLAKAIGYFEKAIELDPGYARAWAGLGEARNGQAASGGVPANEEYRKAREAVARALSLDANLGEAHAAMAWIQQFHDWDWAGADASYKRALSLEPGNATIISHAGILARILGRFDEASALGRRAMQIDPLSPGNYHNAGISLYYAGRYGEAMAAFRKALELYPEMAIAHDFLGRAYLLQSHAREALEEAQKEKHPVLRLLGLTLAHHALGRKKESDADLAELIGKFQSDANYQIAEAYAFRGENDRAFEWLEKASADHNLAEFIGDPLLKKLERDPRHAALVNKMGLPR